MRKSSLSTTFSAHPGKTVAAIVGAAVAGAALAGWLFRLARQGDRKPAARTGQDSMGTSPGGKELAKQPSAANIHVVQGRERPLEPAG